MPRHPDTCRGATLVQQMSSYFDKCLLVFFKRCDEAPMSGPREPLTPRQDGGGAPSPLCHQLPGLASFTIRTVALAAAVPRHPSWKGWIRASAKASSSSLGRVARRLLFLLFRASADSTAESHGEGLHTILQAKILPMLYLKVVECRQSVSVPRRAPARCAQYC